MPRFLPIGLLLAIGVGLALSIIRRGRLLKGEGADHRQGMLSPDQALVTDGLMRHAAQARDRVRSRAMSGVAGDVERGGLSTMDHKRVK